MASSVGVSGSCVEGRAQPGDATGVQAAAALPGPHRVHPDHAQRPDPPRPREVPAGGRRKREGGRHQRTVIVVARDDEHGRVELGQQLGGRLVLLRRRRAGHVAGDQQRIGDPAQRGPGGVQGPLQRGSGARAPDRPDVRVGELDDRDLGGHGQRR